MMNKEKAAIQQQLPSLAQVIAMALTYRRILAVWGCPPIVTAFFPIGMKWVLAMFNTMTQGYGLLIIILTTACTAGTYDLIRRKAPTKADLDDALAKSEARLPLFMFVFSFFLIRAVIDPAASYLKISWLLTWTPTIHFGPAIRVSLGMALLGITVVARFVGKSSIVRCSTRPLVNNQFTTLLSSWSAFLYVVAGPSDTPGVVFKPSLQFSQPGQRFQHPTLLSGIVLLVLSIFIGVIIAYSTVLEWFPISYTDRLAKLSITLTCALAVPGQLMFSSLNGCSHELNPKRNLMQPKRTGGRRPILGQQFSFRHFSRLLHSHIASTIFVPFISVTSVHYFDNRHALNDLIPVLGFCFAVAALIALYLTMIDEAIRSVICTPGAKISRFAEEMCGNSSQDICVDVMVHSILHEHSSLIKTIWSPTCDPLAVDLEVKEAKRIELASKQMSDALLRSDSKRSEAPLEEDILRHSILESLGGNDRTSDRTNNLNPENRHVNNIHELIQPKHKVVLGGKQQEPLAVPLVRALCTYVGGLGEALLNCSSIANNPEFSRQTTFVNWVLPPGATVAAEYSVVAIARCLAWNFTSSNKVLLADWRSTHLSMFVPAALSSLFLLRCGISSYAEYHLKKRVETVDVLSRIGIDSPELLHLLHVCDNAATMILQPLLKSQSNLSRLRLDRTLDTQCYRWICELQQ